LQSKLDAFKAISPQTHANSRKSVRQNKLGFAILADPRGEVSAAFGLRFELPDYLIERSGRASLDDLNEEDPLGVQSRQAYGGLKRRRAS
jgi:hypothetical protein